MFILGLKKTLYKIQEQMLQVVGALAWLWSDMVNPDTEVVKEYRGLLYSWEAPRMQYLLNVGRSPGL